MRVFSSQFRVEHISLGAGLSQSSVYSISQDANGFMWIGTQDGLNKYDGLHFRTYYNTPFDTMSLSSSNIMSLYHDSKGKFWIGTENGGLNFFIESRNQFSNYLSEPDSCGLSYKQITVISEDNNGTIWVGTANGLIRWNGIINANGKNEVNYESIFFDSTSMESNYITSIYCKKNNELFVGTKKGLFHFLISKENLIKQAEITDEGKNYEFLSKEINCIENDGKRIWFGLRDGIAYLESGSFKYYKWQTDQINKQNRIITCLNYASDSKLYIGTNKGLYELNVDSISTYSAKLNIVYSGIEEIKGSINSIKEDKINKGLLWVGTDADGLYKLVPVIKNFRTNHLNDVMPVAFVFSLLQDKQFTWIGTSDGLVRYDTINNKYDVFRSGDKTKYPLSNSYITKVEKDNEGRIWIGTVGGLHRLINPYSKSPQFRKINLIKNLSAFNIRELYRVENKMYVVLPKRVLELNLNNDSARILIDFTGDTNRVMREVINSSFVIDKENNFWVSTNHGLFYYKGSEKRDFNFKSPEIFNYHSNDTSGIRCDVLYGIANDSKGNIWASTANGLTKITLSGNQVQFRNYSVRDGLKNNAVYGILENKTDGSVWCSTNGGLSRLNTRTDKFSNYNIHDGLQSNEFDAGAYYKADNNCFYFGGVSGYSWFNPSEIFSDTTKPHVFITSFNLTGNNKSELLITDSTRKLSFAYNNNSFSIEFIALHYSDPEKNNYAYMLEGYQKDWNYCGNIHEVNFSQLPPGSYTFRVKGSNNDGAYNESGDSIQIIIRPPFWKTTLFYLAIVLLIVSVFWLIHIYRLKQKMHQLSEIDRIRKETASDFHDELGHKITTISWFSDILKRKIHPSNQEQQMYLEKIIDTSGNLYHTMKDLLWAMDPGKDSLDDLYDHLKEFGESLFDQTGVQFIAAEKKTNFLGRSIPLTHKRHVMLIFKEAMHNSFRHSRGNKVSLDAEQVNNHFTVRLNDNGRGFKVNDENQGYGLINVRKRAELIKGKLIIHSDENGTRLELEIPLS